MTTTEIVRSVPTSDAYLLSPVMDIGLAKQRLQEFQSFIRDYLVEGEDFGKIPGAPKPTLLKPGADKLCELYGLADDYEFIERVEDFDRSIFDYTIKCILTDRRRGLPVSAGLGSCNSLEQKYRWREARRLCPQCGKDAIIKGKEEYGGGWLCFAKKGGCGAKFSANDPAIIDQPTGRTPNEDVADLKNTILKMAKKRAKIDATLSATRSSGVFTQDIEDMPHFAEPMSPKEEPAPAPKTVNAKPAKVDDATLEANRVKWLDTIAPMSKEVFAEEVVGKMPEDVQRTLVMCANDAVLASCFNRLDTPESFSAFFVPLNRVAFEIRKDFIKLVRAEAVRRGYEVDRANGAYVQKKEKK